MQNQDFERPKKHAKWKRRIRRLAIVTLVCGLFGFVLMWNHIRTLSSLKRVAGTNAFVMDYYLDYSLDEIESDGMDVHNIEDSCIETFFPDFLLPIAQNVKRWFIPKKIESTSDQGHHCSTLFLRGQDGTCFFARNHDWKNDAFLILRVHDKKGLASIALIDLAYLNLNRSDLDRTNLIQRIPLLFAPYYAMDGINRHGVAVGVMSVDDLPVIPSRDSSKPDVINSTLMRIILDNAKSTEDALSIAEQYNVHFVDASQHVLIGDSSGRSGIIEHINGRIEFLASSTHWQVCTNHQMHGNSEKQNDEKCSRYRTGSDIAEQLDRQIGFTDVESAVRTMSVENWTMWTSVYNLTNGDLSIGYKGASVNLHRDNIPLDGR